MMATELAEKKPAGNGSMTIKQRLQDPAMIAELGKAMPAHCKPERMARVAITAMTRTPKLAECTQASFFRCLLDLSAWGLEPDGRHAHLIPYGTECTLVLDYKGLVQLAYRSGQVKAIHAEVVRRGDLFAYSSGYISEHVPWFLRDPDNRPKEAGPVYAAYCVVQLKDGTAKHDVMSLEDIEAIRKRSRAGSKGPWVTDFNEMAKKTVFRRSSKWLPLSSEIMEAFHGDDDGLADLKAQQQPKRIAVSDLGAILTPTETVVDQSPPNEGIDEPSPEESSQVADDSPAGAAEPLAVYRAKVRSHFALATNAAKVRVLYDSLIGPEATEPVTDDQAQIVTEEYERRQKDLEASKKK